MFLLTQDKPITAFTEPLANNPSFSYLYTMKKRILFFTLILTSFLAVNNAVVILIPGTFATNSSWWQPGGNFFQELEQQANKNDHVVVPFYWSGALGTTARIQAAELLAKLLLSYAEKEPIIVIAHSHGGNVVNIASQMIHQAKVGPIIQAAEPPSLFSSLFHMMTKAQQKEKTQSDVNEEELEHQIAEAIQRLALLFEEHKQLALPKPKPTPPQENRLIAHVFLLGTPVNTTVYAPNMETIEQLYNIYSPADGIQQVLGLYNQCYPSFNRITNIQLVLELKDSTYDPGHSELHAPIVAQHILSLPTLIASQNDNGLIPDGTIQLYHNKEPAFVPHERVE